MRRLFALLLISALASAAANQFYLQDVMRNGSSTITDEMVLVLPPQQFGENALGRMADACASGKAPGCHVDPASGRVTISRNLAPGMYYTFSTEYGFPFTTYTLQVSGVPTGSFSEDLEGLMVKAGIINESGAGGTAEELDLGDAKANKDNAETLRALKVMLMYTVQMPGGVSEAYAGRVKGEISGSSAAFSLVDVMAESKPVVVKSVELNLAYIAAMAGVAVVVALALMFFTSGARRKVKK